MLAHIFEWSAPCPQAKHHHSRSLISYPPRLVIVGIFVCDYNHSLQLYFMVST